jgi:hypothetical protein
MQDRLLAIQQSDMTHAARSLYSVYLAHVGEDGVSRSADGTPLTQKDAADAMGTSRSSANRYFQKLAEAGWIKSTPIGPQPTIPAKDRQQEETETEDGEDGSNEGTESKTYQTDTSPYQIDTYQIDTVAPSPLLPLRFSFPLFSQTLFTPFLFPSPTAPLSQGMVEKISTAPTECSMWDSLPGWIGRLPPGHHALREELPDDHPARSERHLRYRKAAEWSLRLLEQAEEAIESFRVPSAVRRKAGRDRLGLLQSWADVFRLLQEQGDFEWAEVRYAVHWLFTQSDWLREGYIASVGSLRAKTTSGDQTKFEAILTQALADSSYDGPSSNGRIGGDGRADEDPAQRFERNRRAARRAVAAG